MKKKTVRDVLIREETYRKGAAMVHPGALPTLYHTNGFKVISCEIQKAGAVTRDGKRLEYQVLKVFLEERATPTTPEPWEDGTPTTLDYDNDCAP